jgi:hypothetical protein
MASEPTDSEPSPSVIGVQVGTATVALVVFQTPPPEKATYSVLVSVGCGTMERTRPESLIPVRVVPLVIESALVGPIGNQPSPVAAACVV